MRTPKSKLTNYAYEDYQIHTFTSLAREVGSTPATMQDWYANDKITPLLSEMRFKGILVISQREIDRIKAAVQASLQDKIKRLTERLK